MDLNKKKTRILFFIGSLGPGGKERRLIELLTYLKSKGNYELMVILKKNKVGYPKFYQLNIDHQILTVRWKKNYLAYVWQFYKICIKYKPDIIHVWGRIPAFISIPSVVIKKIPLVNSQIASAPPKIKKRSSSDFIDRINFTFSRIILSNSKAGIEAYKPKESKSYVIYNGINLNRFVNLPSVKKVKTMFKIKTPFAVIMVASFTEKKNYDLYYRVAHHVSTIRYDISFIGVGGSGKDGSQFRKFQNLAKNNQKIIFPGKIDDVEALINACDIGVLFSPHGEGISNAILEYMALGKPVIANDAGGTKEFVKHNVNGYLLNNVTVEEISSLIIDLIDNGELRNTMGQAGKRIIQNDFCIEKMGLEVEKVYHKLMNN